MKLLTIIGTRPQYIKIKPLHDYFKKNNIDNVFVDTNQHYSSNVSSSFINDLSLTIDKNLEIKNHNEFDFIGLGICKLSLYVDSVKPDVIIVVGDTNSSLIGALVSRKKGIKLAHIEAGIRCGNKTRPEEMNRVLIDELANIHFTSRKKDNKNVSNPVYVGDLEYACLNKLEADMGTIVTFPSNILMTIHRFENTNPERLEQIFDFCAKHESRISFFVHHRTESIIEKYKICIPDNVDRKSPLSWLEMIYELHRCKGIITDSGGIVKISPFFGKKCLIPSRFTEWDEVVEKGYGQLGDDIGFLEDYKMPRDKKFYYVKDSCKLITEALHE
jgi:UDP-GlcNAc3NAcA epimerase